MVNVKKERVVLENQIKQIGDGDLTAGYSKLGLPGKYLEGGSARRRIAEVQTKINAYNALPAPKEEPEEDENKSFTEEELEGKTFKELKAIGNAMGTTGRGKQELINEILEIQNE